MLPDTLPPIVMLLQNRENIQHSTFNIERPIKLAALHSMLSVEC